MISIAIVEDEESCANTIKRHIENYSQKSGQTFKVFWFSDGLKFLIDYKANYDIIFMDIVMPNLDGIKTSKKLREIDQSVALIFITNMMQYAVKGYEVNALDFMVKPVKYYDFEMKLIKAINYIDKNYDDKITITMVDAKIKIRISDIYYIEVFNHKLIYHTENGKFETYGQLKKVEGLLAGKNFYRSNDCYLTNLRHVNEVYSDHIVVGKENIQISRRKKKEFMEQLTEYLSGGIVC